MAPRFAALRIRLAAAGDGWRAAAGWIGSWCVDDNGGRHRGAEVGDGTLGEVMDGTPSAHRLRSPGGTRLGPHFAVLRIRVVAAGDGMRAAAGRTGSWCVDDNGGRHLGAEVGDGTLCADRLRSRGGSRLGPHFAVLRICLAAGGDRWCAAGGEVGGSWVDESRVRHLGAEVGGGTLGKVMDGTLCADRLRSRGGARLAPHFTVVRIRRAAGGDRWRAAGAGSGHDRARRLLAEYRSRLRCPGAPRERRWGPDLAVVAWGEARSRL
ncbi:MAG: hypothetical protein MUF54_18320 [Polyangiaceae bacterium]|nr:hypothetical protein [Polyangiaceae bacterium]